MAESLPTECKMCGAINHPAAVECQRCKAPITPSNPDAPRLRLCQYCSKYTPITEDRCTNCGELLPLYQQSKTQIQESWSRQSPQDTMGPIGVFLMLIGGAVMAYFLFFFDTSVAVQVPEGLSGLDVPSRVNNLGLMNDRTVWIIVSGMAVFAGLFLYIQGNQRKSK